MALARSAPLKRGKRLKPRSDKRQLEAETGEHELIWEVVLRRDRRCLLDGRIPPFSDRCYGPLTPHHLWKSGQQGPYIAVNLVVLCAHHNGEIENYPPEAHDLGFVVRAGESIREAWERLVAAGLVMRVPDFTPEESLLTR